MQVVTSNNWAKEIQEGDQYRLHLANRQESEVQQNPRDLSFRFNFDTDGDTNVIDNIEDAAGRDFATPKGVDVTAEESDEGMKEISMIADDTTLVPLPSGIPDTGAIEKRGDHNAEHGRNDWNRDSGYERSDPVLEGMTGIVGGEVDDVVRVSTAQVKQHADCELF